jgi:ubiquinone/menaquinone biosynthesis C-methylase UbiE
MKEEKRTMLHKEKECGQQDVSFLSPEVAAGYAQQMKGSRNLFEGVTQRMLAAAVREGAHILDIAAGTGEQSLLAARNVGPTGSVLATDT